MDAADVWPVNARLAHLSNEAIKTDEKIKKVLHLKRTTIIKKGQPAL